jgi:hypothetical protein
MYPLDGSDVGVVAVPTWSQNELTASFHERVPIQGAPDPTSSARRMSGDVPGRTTLMPRPTDM